MTEMNYIDDYNYLGEAIQLEVLWDITNSQV